MQYTVLARKYRPQTFEQIYAQDHVTKILASSVEKDRIAGAYLFTGPRGVGKTSLARIFAKSLNCQSGPTVNPCGECSNCKEIEKAISYDVVEIDGASNTGVDDIRELQKDLMFSTTSSRYKIYIIDEVHMLSTSAFNALLKTLEEPPERVIFLFATTEPHKILPTILSRCQRFDLKRIPYGAILENLREICKKEEIEFEEPALSIIARKADGGMRDALSLLDQMISYSAKLIRLEDVLFMFGVISWQVYLQILQKISEQDTTGVLAEFTRIVDEGNSVSEFMTGFLKFLSTLLTLFYNGKSENIPDMIANDALDVAKKFGERTLILLIDILAEAINKIKYSGNQIFIAELMLIRLSKVENLKSVDKIISYLTTGAKVEKSQPETSDNVAEPKQKVSVNKTVESVKTTVSANPPKVASVIEESDENSDEVASEKVNKVLTQAEFDAALPEIVNLLKENDFNVYVNNFFATYPKKVLQDNLLQIELPNAFELSSFESDKEKLTKFLSRYFGAKLQLSLKVNESLNSDVPQSKKADLPESSDERIAKIEKKYPKVAEFIKEIDGEIVR